MRSGQLRNCLNLLILMDILKRVEISEIGEIIPDKDAVKFVIAKDEHVFTSGKSVSQIGKDDPILEIEIALRRCERTGVFNND